MGGPQGPGGRRLTDRPHNRDIWTPIFLNCGQNMSATNREIVGAFEARPFASVLQSLRRCFDFREAFADNSSGQLRKLDPHGILHRRPYEFPEGRG